MPSPRVHQFVYLLCGAVLAIIFSLGYWPFHARLNNVTWLSYRHGVRFEESSTAIATRDLPAGDVLTVELWLQPSRPTGASTVLAVHPLHTTDWFAIRQSDSDLELRAGDSHIYFGDTFRPGKPVFLAIATGPAGTAVYRNGALVRKSPFRVPPSHLTGRLILGDGPAQPDAWSGRIFGLAIYCSILSTGAIERHFRGWTNAGRPDVEAADLNSALYLFDDGSGSVIHDRSTAGIDLEIPHRYRVVDKRFMEPFWEEFGLNWSYWDTIPKNIVGFLPVGFCFYPLIVLRRARRPVLVTTLLGTLISLTIEIFQFFLPNRDSGTTDLFTNTLGTYLGVRAFQTAGKMLSRWSGKYQTNLIS